MTKKEETMFSLVEVWRESGKTRKEFCNTHNMKVSTFAYWITRKNKTERDGNRQGHDYSPPVFLPIDVSGSDPRTTSVDIFYPNGVRLSVPMGEAALIRNLIRLW